MSYTYGDGDHKHAVTSLSSGWSYQYDQNGNMTERNVGSSTYSLTYDAYNHLISVSGASSVDFVYDGDGQRVKVGGTVYIGDYYRYYGSGCTKFYFANGKRIALRFNTGSQANNYYYLCDHLNSSTVLVNADRSYIGREGYKVWGETRFGGVGLRFKFIGEYYVSNIALYHFGARFYDPVLGRFTQADTLVPGNQGVQGFDRYTYANNSPLRYIDPTGHSIWDVVGAFSTGLVYEFARVNAWMSPQAQEALSVNATESNAMLAGRITADVSSIVVGMGEVAGGIAVGTGGTVVACGTTLCIGAVATVSVGAVMAAQGSITALAGAAGLGGNLAQISNNNTSSDSFDIDEWSSKKPFEGIVQHPDGSTTEFKVRKTPGRDGGWSRMSIIRDANGKVIEVKHEAWLGTSDPTVDSPDHYDYKPIDD